MKTFTVESSWGTLVADAATGDVLVEHSHYRPECHRPAGDGGGPTSIANIFRFDVGEWRRAYPTEPLEGETLDILDLGYWQNRTPWAGYVYEPPEESWRSDFRHTYLDQLSR